MKSKTEEQLLRGINDKAKLLTQQMDVKINDNGILVIESIKLSRSGNGGKQYNHIIPVALFLASIKFNLQRQNDIYKVFDNLSHIYRLDEVDYDKCQALKQYYDKMFVKTEMSNSQLYAVALKNTLKDYVIPLIYSSWNERDSAIFKKDKGASKYGAEGAKVTALTKEFTSLYDNKNELSNFDDFKSAIMSFIETINKNIDLPDNFSPKVLPKIIMDIRRELNIAINVIESSKNNIFLYTEENIRVLKEEVLNWHKTLLEKDKFGRGFIRDNLKIKDKQQFLDEWTKYLQNTQNFLQLPSTDDTQTLSESDTNPSLEHSPARHHVKKIEYNAKTIEQILATNTGAKIEVLLGTTAIAQRHSQKHKSVTDALIRKIEQYLMAHDNNRVEQRYLIINSSNLVSTDMAYIAHLYCNGKDWKLDIISLVNHNQVYDVEFHYIYNDLENFDVNLPGPKIYNDLGITSARFEQIIEYAKLRIKKYPALNSANFEQYKSEYNHIANMQLGAYTEEHYQESREDTTSLLLSPSHFTDNADPDFVSNTNIDTSLGSHTMITRLKSRTGGNIQNVAGTSGVGNQGVLKRKGDSITASEKEKSPSLNKKKVRFDADDVKGDMERFHEFQQAEDEIGLEASEKGCAVSSSSRKRKTRDICQEESLESYYNPLEDIYEQESIKINSRSYINLAYLFSLQHRDNMPENIKLDNVISYAKNIGDIINEGEVNHSTREQELLKTYYQEAQEFFSKYSKDNLFSLVTKENKPVTNSGYLFTNGQQTLLVSDHDNYYQLYSQDYNYRLLFQTKDVNFLAIKNLAKKFFQWRSGGNTEYKIFTLSENLPQDVIIHLIQAPFWTPDNVVSDLVLLNKEHTGSIESVPSEVVRELFFLNNKTPDIEVLNHDFFQLNKDGITFRADILHKVLPALTEQRIQALGDVIKKYNLSVDTQCFDLIPESNKNLLQNYNNKIFNQLKSSEVLNFDKISQLSWETLNHEFETGSFEGINYKDILPKETREKALNSFKDLHANAHSKFHALKSATKQVVFLLPDIIRSFNTGDSEGLIKTVGMIGGDMFLDRTLFSKLPITSPIFKIITFYSIGELHKKLNSLPPNSEEASIIRHHLGEQYFTVGLMFIEMCGFETGPLWIGLMAEQMLYGAIALRNQYHLPDTSLWEAFLINLGFYQDELPIIFEERHLLDVQLKFLDEFNFPSAWSIVYLPDVKDVRWKRINLKDIPSEVNNYIQANHNLACKLGFKIGPSNHVYTCEYAGFKKSKYTNGDIWQQQIFDIFSKNREIKFVPTKIHQAHNVFQNIQYPIGERINKQYIRIASNTIEQTNDPDVLRAQVAQIEGGMSAIYFNCTTWWKCLSNGPAGPCSISQGVWLNGPYRHNMIMLFDPKVHSNTNIYFHPEGLNHLDQNYFSHVNNEYLAKEEHDKCTTDLNDYCFEHLKPNIPDTYSLLIVLYNVVYPNSVNFIRTTNNTKLRIESNHNTNINTNYIIDANALKQVVPFAIYDYARNMSITLTNIRQDKIYNLALWQQKLSSKNLGTSGYGMYFNTEEKLIIPGYKDSIAIFIMQPMGWYIDELILSVKYCNIMNAEGKGDNRPGKIILEKIAAHDHSFDIQLISNMHIIDKNSEMQFSVFECMGSPIPIKYSKLPGNQFIIESCDNLQPFDLHWPLSDLSRIQNIKENIISFFKYPCQYTFEFFGNGNDMITIRGILDNQPGDLALIIHNGKLYEYILSIFPNNDELSVIEHVHYDQQIILHKSELNLTEIIKHKNHDIPVRFRDQSDIPKYLKNGITLVLYSHGNIIKHHFLTDSPNINNITYSIKDGNVLCAKIETKQSIMNKDFIWYKSTVADNKKCLEFSTDIENVSIINGTLNINGVDIVDMPKQIRIVSPGNIMSLSFFHNLVGTNIMPQAEDQLEELLSSSATPRLRRTIKEDKQYSEEIASVIIDEQQINMNDELANINTYNVARSSASILEPSFLFNNGLWNWVWNKVSNFSFKLLPEADTATLDNSKSFNDIYKLIKQLNNPQSDTQINKLHDITSQYDYAIPSSKYKNAIPLSVKDQKLHCVPYSWDSNNQVYVTDVMTCVSPSGQAKVFSNVHQKTNFIQTKGYAIQGEDIYKNCRPVEFYGRDSVYCEAKHTNMIYTPVFQSKFFDNLDVQIMLFKVGIHLVKKALDYLKPKQEYREKHIETDKETINLWTKSIEKVVILLNDLQDLENLNQEDLKFINETNDDLCEIRQNIKNNIEKKMITTKEYKIINERLGALIEELDEIENRYFVDTKEDCNQETSIEQLHILVMVYNTVYNEYYIDHNNSQEYYNNSYLLYDARPVLTDFEVMNQNFGGNNMMSPSLIGNTTEIGSLSGQTL